MDTDDDHVNQSNDDNVNDTEADKMSTNEEPYKDQNNYGKIILDYNYWNHHHHKCRQYSPNINTAFVFWQQMI